ncbi:MAG: LysR family transcriptional regulator [Sphingomonadales bacterium]
MYDWNDLRHFLELSRAGKLSLAADRLGVDHTTVARRVTALEAALGARLFDRSPKGYRLTESGQRLLPLAEAMESQSLTLARAIGGLDAAPSGTVRLATPEAFGSQFLAWHLAGLKARHPGVELELIAETRPLSLTKREADVAIMLARPSRGRLVAWKLGAYHLGLYAAPSYLRGRAPLMRRDDLGAHDFIWYVDDLLQFEELRGLLSRQFKDPHVVFRSTNIAAQAHACQMGMGLALLHCFHADRLDGLVRVLPGDVCVERSLWLAVHEDLRHVARVDAVCGFLTELARRQRDVLAPPLPAHASPDITSGTKTGASKP